MEVIGGGRAFTSEPSSRFRFADPLTRGPRSAKASQGHHHFNFSIWGGRTRPKGLEDPPVGERAVAVTRNENARKAPPEPVGPPLPPPRGLVPCFWQRVFPRSDRLRPLFFQSPVDLPLPSFV